MATQTRLELVTSSVTGWRSNQLSYWAGWHTVKSRLYAKLDCAQSTDLYPPITSDYAYVYLP